MMESDIVRGYAHAILDVARAEGMLDRVEQELTQFLGVLEKNYTLQEFLKDPKVTSKGKQKAIAEILGREVSEITLRQIALAIEQERGSLLLKIVEHFFRLAAESRRKITTEVTTAVPVSEETRKELEEVFSELVGQAVYLKTSVDPSLLGSVVVRIGERIIDGSVQRQLDRLRQGIHKGILAEKGWPH